MILAGVIGWPVEHSLSPRLHAFWLAAHGIDGAYVPLPVQQHAFSLVIDGLRAAGFAGVNVTLPHKVAAFALADIWDAESCGAGAANLLLFRNGRIEARNTDAGGLCESLCAALAEDILRSKRTVILGAGGAARAAVLAAAKLGAAEIHVLNRTRSRAENLVAALQRTVSAKLAAASLAEWPALAANTRLLINATSAGLRGAPSILLSLDAMPRESVVCDLVYDPLDTPLLASARGRGLRTLDGLGMLMHQAAPAFEAFFGERPEITDAARRHLEQAL